MAPWRGVDSSHKGATDLSGVRKAVPGAEDSFTAPGCDRMSWSSIASGYEPAWVSASYLVAEMRCKQIPPVGMVGMVGSEGLLEPGRAKSRFRQGTD